MTDTPLDAASRPTADFRPSRRVEELLAIMARLRTPNLGCGWDLAQTFASIAPYTIEEAYEVADAIARGDRGDLREELGDLLLQVVFHARMAEEEGAFAFSDVVETITAKLIRRHPHVFGSAQGLPPDEVKAYWKKVKAEEKAEKSAERENVPRGVLADVPITLPALTRGLKLQSKAGEVGFDWNDISEVLKKIVEETNELVEAAAGHSREAIAEEVGDLLFAMVNIARHLDVDPEAALAATNAKFVRRFEAIEASLAARGKTPATSTLEEMDALWNAAKREERERPRQPVRS